MFGIVPWIPRAVEVALVPGQSVKSAKYEYSALNNVQVQGRAYKVNSKDPSNGTLLSRDRTSAPFLVCFPRLPLTQTNKSVWHDLDSVVADELHRGA